MWLCAPPNGTHLTQSQRWRSPSPVILISPISGSDTLIVDGCAEIFAEQGWHAVIISRFRHKFDPNEPVSQVEDILRTAVIRQRQALDWLLTQPGVDPNRVGTFGISYGGIINAALAAVEPRAKFHVIDLAGGPLPGVMRTSDERSLRRNWDRSRVSHDLTNRQFYEALQKVVRTDPVKLADVDRAVRPFGSDYLSAQTLARVGQTARGLCAAGPLHFNLGASRPPPEPHEFLRATLHRVSRPPLPANPCFIRAIRG
jgi:pimeloyl-ACP methyl ester carboxylesterase